MEWIIGEFRSSVNIMQGASTSSRYEEVCILWPVVNSVSLNYNV